MVEGSPMAVAEAKARILAMMVVVINFILCFFVCVFVVSEFVDTLVQDAIILASLEMCEASKHKMPSANGQRQRTVSKAAEQ